MKLSPLQIVAITGLAVAAGAYLQSCKQRSNNEGVAMSFLPTALAASGSKWIVFQVQGNATVKNIQAPLMAALEEKKCVPGSLQTIYFDHSNGNPDWAYFACAVSQ